MIFIIRGLNWILELYFAIDTEWDIRYLQVGVSTTQVLLWLILYLFVFDLQQVRDKLQCNSLDQYKIKYRITKIKQYIIITGTIIT